MTLTLLSTALLSMYPMAFGFLATAFLTVTLLSSISGGRPSPVKMTFAQYAAELRGILVDDFGIKLIPDRASFSLIDGYGIAVIREVAGFAEEDSRGLFSRQAGDVALGRYDHHHIGMRTRSKR